MILILLSIAVILTYVGVMVKRNGIPYSISDTYYSLKHKLWFGFTMTATSLLLMPTLLPATPRKLSIHRISDVRSVTIRGCGTQFQSRDGPACTHRRYHDSCAQQSDMDSTYLSVSAACVDCVGIICRCTLETSMEWRFMV